MGVGGEGLACRCRRSHRAEKPQKDRGGGWTLAAVSLHDHQSDGLYGLDWELPRQNAALVSPGASVGGRRVHQVPTAYRGCPGRVSISPSAPRTTGLQGGLPRGCQERTRAHDLQTQCVGHGCRAPALPPASPPSSVQPEARGQTNQASSRGFWGAPSTRLPLDYMLQRPACSLQTERIHSLTSRPIKK